MLFAGNLTRHPCLAGPAGDTYRIAAPLTQTDRVVADTFWTGVYPGLSDENIGFMVEHIRKAAAR